jgi:hypothetical protein
MHTGGATVQKVIIVLGKEIAQNESATTGSQAGNSSISSSRGESTPSIAGLALLMPPAR